MRTNTVPEDVSVWGISDLTAAVKGALDGQFENVWVRGEVSNLARPSSGHLYLTLKDPYSQVKSVIYRGVALRLRFEPRDGLSVIARGRVSVYEPRGEYQFIVEELHPKGIGAAELALKQLREKLFTLGYFAPDRKRPLPRFPERIALVTSPSGAAVRDMLEILARRWPSAQVVIRPVPVQGDGAGLLIAEGISHVNDLHQSGEMPIDVIIVGRGGGSSEDLSAFNEEVVAKAIFESRIPVVTAVGHEIDTTIADLVADMRAATPSHAAVAVCPDRQELLAGLAALETRLRSVMLGRLQGLRTKLDELASRPALRSPLERLRDAEKRLAEIGERLTRAARLIMSQTQDRLAALANRLESLSPLAVLARGYSLTRLSDGTVLRSSHKVWPGDRVRIRLASGEIVGRVEEVNHDDV